MLLPVSGRQAEHQVHWVVRGVAEVHGVLQARQRQAGLQTVVFRTRVGKSDTLAQNDVRPELFCSIDASLPVR